MRGNLVMPRAQFCDPDARMVEAHRQAVQRVCAVPWMSFPPALMQGMRSVDFDSDMPKLSLVAAVIGLRACSASFGA